MSDVTLTDVREAILAEFYADEHAPLNEHGWDERTPDEPICVNCPVPAYTVRTPEELADRMAEAVERIFAQRRVWRVWPTAPHPVTAGHRMGGRDVIYTISGVALLLFSEPADVQIDDDLTLHLTCPAVPEQYDLIRRDGEIVGYFRLRHGYFTVTFPDVGGKLVYTRHFAGDPWKGQFDTAEERRTHLLAGVAACVKEMARSDA